MFVDFFIKRPVFASVCSLIIILVGAVSIPSLAIAQYPDISPTQVSVSANYNGASAEVVENTVTTILERQINGVEGLKYIESSSSNDGSSSITVTFDASRNKDIAAVDIQNKVSQAQPQLPEAVKQTGVTVAKKTGTPLMGFGLYTDNKEYDNLFLSNYADLYLVDALKKLPGVGDVTIFGERKYAMRLWLDPNRLASRNITAQDVVDALNEQNLQVGVGRIGQQPSPDGQMYQIDLTAISRLIQPTEFENIVLKTDKDGTLIKIQDVGRAELGAQDYNSFLRYRGKDAVGLGIYQLPGSNALQVAEQVRAGMEKLSQKFPPGMKYGIGFDTTPYVQESLKEVVKTLFEALVLVIFVIFVFLQDWRTTLIPSITIPVSLIGTFAFIKLFGFSINSLSLFGLTLATGLVVDDAIIVVEDVSRLIQEEGMKPRQAASKAMGELFGALIATGLVLLAVFIPVAFFPGTTGALYKQFALTIAFSIALSVFNALTLTPALSALLLRQGQKPGGWMGWLFDRFNSGFDRMRRAYQRTLNVLTRFKAAVIGMFVLSLGLTGWLYLHVPTAFLPEDDQGYFITLIQAPEGVSLNYTSDVIRKVEKQLLRIPEVRATFAIGGFSLGGGNIANNGVIFTTLTPWEERTKQGQSAMAIIDKLRPSLLSIPEARVFPVNAPAIAGLSNFGGFQYKLEDKGGNTSLDTMLQIMGGLLGRANQTPGLQAVFSTYSANAPQIVIEVDRNKAKALQVAIKDVFNTLQSFLGSQYVNDFNLARRTYRVYIQADKQFRSNPEDIGRLYVRSQTGQMIPLSNLVKMKSTIGAQTINHYNLFRSIEINGSSAPGFSSGQALQKMEQLSKEVLPVSMGYEWSGSSAEELSSGGQAPLIFGLGLIFVFLVLSAQYENYVDPIIILLSVPLAILGALSAQSLRGFADDVYCQIGLVMLIGLASKNAILIVEFANQAREKGASITKAAVEASQERLRPILMTAFAFILGLLPLVYATGAGAPARQSLGTAVCGGMIVSTILSLFIVPIIYIVINTLRDRLTKGGHNSKTPESNLDAHTRLPEEIRRR